MLESKKDHWRIWVCRGVLELTLAALGRAGRGANVKSTSPIGALGENCGETTIGTGEDAPPRRPRQLVLSGLLDMISHDFERIAAHVSRRHPPYRSHR